MKTSLNVAWIMVKVFWHVIKGPMMIAFFIELGRQFSVGWSAFRGMAILNVVIIKCSKYEEPVYDDDGKCRIPPFVLRHWKGSLSSNTQATMYGLAYDLEQNMRLGANVRIVQHVFDDSVQVVRPTRISRLCRLWRGKSLVMLVGVQTNQMPRATDLAQSFKDQGLDVIIGGFHVSGVIAQFGQESDPDHQRAFDELGLSELLDPDVGVSIFAGESEGQARAGQQGRLEEILRNCLDGQMKPIYNYLDALPDISNVPMPISSRRMRKHYVSSDMGTIDQGRGCPFTCEFCCIITVQGNSVRSRSVAAFKDAIRAGWKEGIKSWFFTSDNFSRSKHWRKFFEAMIELQDEGVYVRFLIQVDTKAYLLPKFVKLAAQAGCGKAFIGLESLDKKNTKEVGKTQNDPVKIPAMIDLYHEHGIMVYFGYMVGLPYDTPESVAGYIDELIDMKADQLSIFIASPCPGAADHTRMFRAGVAMDSDLNRYDTVRPVTDHPLMSREELGAVYDQTWKTMTSVETLIKILKRSPKHLYWHIFRSLAAYKHAIDVCGQHPMLSGFIPIRNRLSIRSGYRPMGRLRFFFYNLGQHISYFGRFAKLVLVDLLEIWLRSRPRTEEEKQLVERLTARPQFRRWRSVRLSDLRETFRSQGLRVPKRAKLLRLRISLRTTRSDLDAYWTDLRQGLRQGKYWLLLKWETFQALVAEWSIQVIFITTLLLSWRKHS